MKRQTPDPLSPEERALADRLARLGPNDGPSPALDAKILAAAHAAAASTRAPARARRRWALSAIPGGLITGFGVAATMALAVGVVWQLRPISPSMEAPVHEPADGAYTSAEMISRPRELIAPPPPPAPVVAQAESRAAATAAAPAAPSLAAAAAKPSADAAAQGYAASDAPPPRDLRQQRDDKASLADDSDAAASTVAGNAAARAAPAHAPPMPAAAPAPAGADASDNFGLVPTRSRRAAEAAEERREAEAGLAQAKRAEAKQTEARQAQAEPADAGQAATLDRVEVTGSRIKRAEIETAQPIMETRPAAFPLPPVHEDTRLERADWLDRIRARRDAGQADEARASLALFRKSHPRVRVPDDLRALLR